MTEFFWFKREQGVRLAILKVLFSNFTLENPRLLV